MEREQEEEEIEIPSYFICPISLHIMKDPVTAITGITYDRESIEHWLFKNNGTGVVRCPVTKQPLPRDSDLTPNHTLRRLIQLWCTENSIDRIPTPRPPLSRRHVTKLIRSLWNADRDPVQIVRALMQLEALAAENERNRKQMAEVGVPCALLTYVVTCCDKNHVVGLEEALRTLHLFNDNNTWEIMKLTAFESDKIVESFTWVLGLDSVEGHNEIKSQALKVLENMIEASAAPGSDRHVYSNFLDRLKPEFFGKIIRFLKQKGITRQGVNAALHVMLEACPLGRNRLVMVQYGAVFELIELELSHGPERKTTELVLGVLFHLCSCADGRAQFLSHRAAVAVVTKRIMEVSPAADDRAVLILSMVCKFSGNRSLVAQEMLRVGTVMKLCSLLQVDCGGYLKEKAREMLKARYDEWKDSPCIDASVFTRLTT